MTTKKRTYTGDARRGDDGEDGEGEDARGEGGEVGEGGEGGEDARGEGAEGGGDVRRGEDAREAGTESESLSSPRALINATRRSSMTAARSLSRFLTRLSCVFTRLYARTSPAAAAATSQGAGGSSGGGKPRMPRIPSLHSTWQLISLKNSSSRAIFFLQQVRGSVGKGFRW